MTQESQGGLVCIHCLKPLSQWRAREECSGRVTIALLPATVLHRLSATSRDQLETETQAQRDFYDGKEHKYCERCGDCVLCDVPHECLV